MKTKKATENNVFSELERICRMVVNLKIEESEIAYIRKILTDGLVSIEKIRDEKQKKLERQTQIRETTKRINALEEEISRVLRYGQVQLAEKLREECERLKAERKNL